MLSDWLPAGASAAAWLSCPTRQSVLGREQLAASISSSFAPVQAALPAPWLASVTPIAWHHGSVQGVCTEVQLAGEHEAAAGRSRPGRGTGNNLGGLVQHGGEFHS